MKIKKKDKVLVIAGKDAGKKAEVLHVFPNDNTVTVAGVNVVKKAVKPTKKTAGGIIEVEKPVSVSNVALVCPSCGKAARVGFQITKSGEKERICKACKAVVKE
jgi:large subunit ribosomal protein L24